jgi:hypothetical protein
MERTNLVGKKFGPLLVLGEAASKGAKGYWEVLCDCGKIATKAANELLRKNRPIRGCCHQCTISRNLLASQRTTHGMSGTPLYIAWRNLLDRTQNPKCLQYKNYGGRGIQVCERWQKDFGAFLRDMGGSWEAGLDIDRTDNDQGYSPENCRWVSRKENNRNKRNNIRREDFPADWREQAQRVGLKWSTLHYRIHQGWSWEEIIKTPVAQPYSELTPELLAQAEAKGVSRSVLTANLAKGKTVAEILEKPFKPWRKSLTPEQVAEAHRIGLPLCTVRQRKKLGWPPELWLKPVKPPFTTS